jgi:hypothetical protein
MDGVEARASRIPLWALRRRVAALQWAGRGEEAAWLAFAHRDRYPEQPAMLALWLAEVQAEVRHDPGSAVTELERALDAGAWWSEVLLRAQRFFEPLVGDGRFEAVVAEGEARRRVAQSAVVPTEPLIVWPQPERRGVLVVLHGRIGRLPSSARPWLSAIDQGLVVIAPLSSQLSSSDGTFDWPDDALALDEVRAALAGVMGDRRARGLPLLAGGLSRGARLAIRFSLGHELPTDGFVAVCPVMRDRASIGHELARPHRRRPIGAVITGRWDWARPDTQEVCDELTAAGVDVQLQVAPDTGHGYPPDFARRLGAGASYILEKQPRRRDDARAKSHPPGA